MALRKKGAGYGPQPDGRISLRDNPGARFSIVGVALVVLIAAILFSKRGGATLAADGPTDETARVGRGRQLTGRSGTALPS